MHGTNAIIAKQIFISLFWAYNNKRVSTAASLGALPKREISVAANRFRYSVIVSAAAAATGLEQHSAAHIKSLTTQMTQCAPVQ